MFVHKEHEKPVWTLADILYYRISLYEDAKRSEPNSLKRLAEYCLVYIDKAYAYGVIQPTDGLLGKLQESRTEKIKLEKEFNALSSAYLQLQSEFKEFKTRIGLKTKDEWRKKSK